MAPKVETVPTADCKKSVAVIGAGASGLTVMKELTSLGHSVVCFEENIRIGGVYTKSYDRTMLTTSSLLTSFSDYSNGMEDSPKFWTDEEYLDYLDGFACKFDLYKHIQFRTTVKKCVKCPKTNKWLVTVEDGAFTWPHRSTFLLGRRHSKKLIADVKNVKGKEVLDDFYSRAEKEGFENIKNTYAYKYFDHVTGEEKMMRPKTGAGVERTFAVDSIAVATGTNTWAALPRFNGQAEYEAAGGLVIHSENYKKPEVFKDQNVLIVGAGESGSDICNEIADEAAKVAIAIRGKHGHLIPRKQADGRVTDLNTNRCRCAAAHTRAARVRPAPSRTPPPPAPALRTSSRRRP